MQFFIWNEEEEMCLEELEEMEYEERKQMKFPLYMKACDFASWKERMIRISSRTLILNIIAIKDDMVEEFLQSPNAYGFIEIISKDLFTECKVKFIKFKELL